MKNCYAASHGPPDLSQVRRSDGTPIVTLLGQQQAQQQGSSQAGATGAGAAGGNSPPGQPVSRFSEPPIPSQSSRAGRAGSSLGSSGGAPTPAQEEAFREFERILQEDLDGKYSLDDAKKRELMMELLSRGGGAGIVPGRTGGSVGGSAQGSGSSVAPGYAPTPWSSVAGTGTGGIHSAGIHSHFASTISGTSGASIPVGTTTMGGFATGGGFPTLGNVNGCSHFVGTLNCGGLVGANGAVNPGQNGEVVANMLTHHAMLQSNYQQLTQAFLTLAQGNYSPEEYAEQRHKIFDEQVKMVAAQFEESGQVSLNFLY